MHTIDFSIMHCILLDYNEASSQEKAIAELTNASVILMTASTRVWYPSLPKTASDHLSLVGNICNPAKGRRLGKPVRRQKLGCGPRWDSCVQQHHLTALSKQTSLTLCGVLEHALCHWNNYQPQSQNWVKLDLLESFFDKKNLKISPSFAFSLNFPFNLVSTYFLDTYYHVFSI